MARTTGDVPLVELIQAGPLRVNERLVLRRRSAPDIEGRLLADGSIAVGDEVFDSPTAAARHVLGRSVHGWKCWRVARLDEWTLDKVRECQGQYQLRLPSGEAGLGLESLAGQPFGCVLADPPWRFLNRTGKVAPEHRRLSRYETMSVEEICALPVADVMADKSHCYLWVPNALLADGLRVLASWGFTYKSMIIWHKIRKDGGSDGRGVGFYFRNVTEPVLFGVRGKLRTFKPGRTQVNYVASRKREHSRKPDEMYDVIESCSPGPYLELFARYPREGWQVWGDEADDSITPRGRVYPVYGGNGNGHAGRAPSI